MALVLFGSLAYLVPVLAGPGERLGANFALMQGWGWVRMLVGNAVPVAVVVGLPAAVAVSVGAAFVADFALRVIRVFWRRSAG